MSLSLLVPCPLRAIVPCSVGTDGRWVMCCSRNVTTAASILPVRTGNLDDRLKGRRDLSGSGDIVLQLLDQKLLLGNHSLHNVSNGDETDNLIILQNR